jgi:hypothetical protein
MLDDLSCLFKDLVGTWLGAALWVFLNLHKLMVDTRTSDFAPSPDFPLQDCNPYRGLHVLREKMVAPYQFNIIPTHL